MSESAKSAGAKHTGRPRAARVDAAIRAAAQRVFVEHGWAKFTFETVSIEAGVGRPALYRRWKNREELLLDCLQPTQLPPVTDSGSFENELTQLASSFLRSFHEIEGLAYIRLMVESILNSNLANLRDEQFVAPRTAANRDVTIRAINRGEVAAGTSPSMIAEIVTGTMLIHYMYTAPHLRKKIIDDTQSYAEKLVKVVLQGCLVDPETKRVGPAVRVKNPVTKKATRITKAPVAATSDGDADDTSAPRRSR